MVFDNCRYHFDFTGLADVQMIEERNEQTRSTTSFAKKAKHSIEDIVNNEHVTIVIQNEPYHKMNMAITQLDKMNPALSSSVMKYKLMQAKLAGLDSSDEVEKRVHDIKQSLQLCSDFEMAVLTFVTSVKTIEKNDHETCNNANKTAEDKIKEFTAFLETLEVALKKHESYLQSI
jgi:hypothetical protein